MDLEDALKEATRVLGGAKALGKRLRPELDVEAAGRWWLDCVNADRPQKPSLEQLFCVVRWARDDGHHGLMGVISRLCGYAAGAPVTDADEQADLRRQFVAAVAQLDKIQHKLMGSP